MRRSNNNKFSKENIEMFYDIYFTKEKYLLAYGDIVHPILDHKMWAPTVETLQSSPLCKIRGRPRNNRRRLADEPIAGRSEMRRS
ncbi:unnamed protein product [Ilex paraguariensis]|uniref:Uncharacterized protein n=1 Tax=Ilex paraguariensis TaxID=185542 RepID=A0ABC8UQK9_9AQUA